MQFAAVGRGRVALGRGWGAEQGAGDRDPRGAGQGVTLAGVREPAAF